MPFEDSIIILSMFLLVGYVGFNQSSYTVKEGDGVMDVCVEMLGDEGSYVLGKPLSLRLSSDGETAEGDAITTFTFPIFSHLLIDDLHKMVVSSCTDGVDFSPIVQIVYFHSGSEPGQRACVSIPIIDDSLEEEHEAINLHLFISDTAIVMINDYATGIIVDNDSKSI